MKPQYINVCKVSDHEITVLTQRKNCDKLFAYTSVFAAVTESYVVPVYIRERRLAGAMASLQEKGASRVKYKLRVCPCGTNLLSGKNKLAEG